MTGEAAANIHATALVCGDTGLLLRGESGSGKSALALRLIDRMARAGRHGALVSDDRVLLDAVGGRLVASAPDAIRGLADLRGFGILPVACTGSAVIDLVADFGTVERMPEAGICTIAGVACRALRLPAGDVSAALQIVDAALRLPHFDTA